MSKKKNIIITGGTDGIGLAAVKQLIEYDDNIYIISKNAEESQRKTRNFVNSATALVFYEPEHTPFIQKFTHFNERFKECKTLHKKQKI